MKFIFKIKIKEGCTEQEYIDAWKKGSALIQKLPGARGTKLHRKIDESGILIAIAEWKSKELRDVAMQKLDQEPQNVQFVLHKHKEYGETEVLGNFEEIETVLPPKN
jgi:hypothetical protein